MALNLSGQDLSGPLFTEYRTQNLVKADLKNTILVKSDLSELDLREADLTGANLTGANLEGAKLNLSDLHGADLTGADLTGANLTGANLEGAILEGADLTRAILYEADLRESYLVGADLKGANLYEADLSESYLRRANLKGANLEGANLEGANLEGANLYEADLTGADLTGAILEGAYLRGADLTGAILEEANLTGSILEGADLTGAILEGANLTGAILEGANLTDVIGYTPNQETSHEPISPAYPPPSFPSTPLSSSPPPAPELQQLMNNIKVFDIIMGDDVTATEFFDENNGKQPYIIKNSQGLFTGAALGWPAPSSSGNEYIECSDDTPVVWNGNSYSKYIKPNARKFIKIIISGSPTMVVKPDWYDSKQIPGTKFFQLVDTKEKVFKFMTTVLASQNLPSDFTALGSDHCNQTSPLGTYKLEPITIEQLKQYATNFGGKNKRKKTRKMNKLKKTKKTNKQKNKKTNKQKKRINK